MGIRDKKTKICVTEREQLFDTSEGQESLKVHREGRWKNIRQTGRFKIWGKVT